MAIENKTKSPAFIFDLGGVLIDWNPKHLLRKLFVGDEAAMEHFLAVVCPQTWNVTLDKGYSFAKAIEERVSMFPEYSSYIYAYYERWEEMVKGEIKETVDILSSLREAGYPLYALSNWSAETFNRVRDQFEFLTWFDDMIISGEVKMVKPHREIFDLLLERIQCEPEDCLFIDDHSSNTEAAESYGFQTILFSSPSQLKTELSERGLL